MTNLRYPYLPEFMHYLDKQARLATPSMVLYERSVKSFYEWLLSRYGHANLKKISSGNILEYVAYMHDRNLDGDSIRTLLTGLKHYFTYLGYQEILDADNLPWPRRIKIAVNKAKLPRVVLSTKEIFTIRMQTNVRLEAALVFELGLSSGMRIGEMRQLVPADFNFNDRPFDQELLRPSPYFVGSIMLHPGKMIIKTQQPRKVYFSYMAGQLLKQFFARHNLDPTDASTCILPWHDDAPAKWLKELADDVLKSTASPVGGSALTSADMKRDPTYQNVDIDKLAVSEKFKASMKRRQASQRISPRRQWTQKQYRQLRTRSLHPHALRHTFTPLMYYRNPMGERHADSALRILLGHMRYETTYVYLRELQVISSDETWKQLWLGKPQDWAGISR